MVKSIDDVAQSFGEAERAFSQRLLLEGIIV